MQLRTARLCLDCEEIHNSQTCPVCASESFAFIARWVPAPERRQRSRPLTTASSSTPTTDKRSMTRTFVKSVAGLAVVSLAGWAWQRARNGTANQVAETHGPPSER